MWPLATPRPKDRIFKRQWTINKMNRMSYKRINQKPNNYLFHTTVSVKFSILKVCASGVCVHEKLMKLKVLYEHLSREKSFFRVQNPVSPFAEHSIKILSKNIEV